jgi:hypothetical protein
VRRSGRPSAGDGFVHKPHGTDNKYDSGAGDAARRRFNSTNKQLVGRRA